MSDICASPVLSICVPTYNGYPYVCTLIEELLKSPRIDFEVIVSDDCSSDETWEFVSAVAVLDSRLRCFRNIDNLGMDKNFARSVSLAQGKYVWLCGQDDRIFHEGIQSVIELLELKPELDFLYLNHTKINEGDEPVTLSAQLDSASDDGRGLNEFLQFHSDELPTFLPKYVIRKSLWDSVEVSRYFGTSYCQVGVFLESAKDLSWSHPRGNFVVGLTPAEGWQFNPTAYARISIGYFAMLKRVSEVGKWVPVEVMRAQCRRHFKRLVYSLLLIRAGLARNVDPLLIKEMTEIVAPFREISIITSVLVTMPRWVANSILNVLKIRRTLRKHS